MVVLAITASAAPGMAQTVTAAPAWALSATLGNAEAIGTDAAGNVYVYGQLSSSGSIGGIPVTKVTGSTGDLWIAKISPSGQALWAKNFGGSGASTSSYGLTVDSAGNSYFVGYYSSAAIDVGTTNLPRSSITTIRDGVVAKLATDGSVVWAKDFPAGAGGSITINAAAVDASGNPVVVAYWTGSATTTIGGTPVTRQSTTTGYDLLVAKLDAASGALTWIQNFGTSTTTIGNANVGVDPSGNVYVNGYFNGASLTIGTALTRAGTSMNLFLAKLGSTGTPIWAKNYGPTTNVGMSFTGTQLNGLAVDRDGNSYFANAFNSGNLDVGGITLTRNSTSSYDMVLAKVDTAGNTVWARNYGTTGSASTTGMGVTVDSSGNVYGSGFFTGATINIGGTLLTRTGSTSGQDGLMMRLNSSGGVVWAHNYGGGNGVNTNLRPVALSGTNVATVGSFSGGSVNFGSYTASNAGGASVFVASIAQTTVDPTPTPTPAPTPVIPPSFVSSSNPPPTVLNADTTGSGQGTVSLASSFSNPSSLTFSATQSTGAALPSWLTFDPSTVSFNYNVPLPANLPVQPSADVSADATARAVKAGRSVVNTVYPLAVLVQTVPVNLTATGGGQSYTVTVNMDFYAPRTPVAITAVSYSVGGVSGNATSRMPALSWDGGQVVFETGATNINAAANSDYTSIVRYQGLSGRRDLLSQTAIPGGGVANAANGNSNNPAVSAAGNYAVFSSVAPGVSLTQNNRLRQIYRASLVYPRVSLNEGATPAAVMLSTTAAGVAADAAADLPAISEQGSFVAFESAAGNLGANPDRLSQIWRKDATTGAVVLVSSTSGGVAGNGDSRNVSLSWDGTIAVFDSTATNLVPGSPVGRHVYLKNLTTGLVYRLSSSAGAGNPRIDARVGSVVYVSSSGTKSQVLRYDIATAATTVVSVTPSGAAGNGDSTQPTLSADGRFVAFRSTATDLVAGYADNGYPQIWIRDVMRGVTALVTQTAAGAPGGGASSDPALSGDGGSIGFTSQATDLVNGTPVPGQIHVAANPLVLPGATAYWSTTDGGNLAWSVERWGDKALVAGLAYNANGGTAVWAAGECRFAGLTCQGTVNQWSQSGMSSTTVGPIALAFSADGRQATMTLGNTAPRTLVPYAIGGTRTTGFAGLPQNGYWGVPGNAAGVNSLFIDTDTQVASNGTSAQKSHVTLFGYDTAGNARWYAAEGTIEADQTFTGQLYLYSGGSTWTSAGSSGQPSASPVGSIRLSFTATDRATMQLPDGRSIAVSRWRF